MPDKKSATKPQAKKAPSLKKQLGAMVTDLKTSVDQSLLRVTDLIRDWRKYRDIVKNNYELGCDHLKRGNLKDAIMRFRFVLWLEPGHASAWYYLGRAYLADGNQKAAYAAFRRSLALKPGNEEIAYLMAVIKGKATPANELPKSIPKTIAQQHFDTLAADYDAEQLERFGYEGHLRLNSALRAQLAPDRQYPLILDLGCGTGLCGALVRDIASRLTGVDLSAAMLAQAAKLDENEGKKTYDALLQREVSEFLPTALPQSYDIVIAAGLLSYVGNLAPIFEQVARILKPGGLFAFYVDKTDDEGGFRFDPVAARFVFSQNYVLATARASGFTKLTLEETPVYPSYLAWIGVFQR